MKNSGFTLVELMIAIAILGILLIVGVPSFNGMMRNSGMRSNSSEMVTALNYARMEAVKTGSRVHLGQRDIVAGWNDGIVAWVDADADDVYDAGEELRLWEAFSKGSDVNGSDVNGAVFFIFNPSGEVSTGGAVTFCDDRTGEIGRKITILSSGAVYAEAKNDC